jgi:hypothetical protein
MKTPVTAGVFFVNGGQFHGHPIAHEANLTISRTEGAVFVARVIWSKPNWLFSRQPGH